MIAAVARLKRELDELGVRARVDRRTDVGLGRRLTDWELKGIPVRLELGPRDLAAQTVSLARRDGSARTAVGLDTAAAAARDGLGAVQDALLAEARAELERRTTEVSTLEQAIEAAGDGFARIAWAACGLDGERRANAAGVTVRCLMRPGGSIPDSADEDDLVAVLARVLNGARGGERGRSVGERGRERSAADVRSADRQRGADLAVVARQPAARPLGALGSLGEPVAAERLMPGADRPAHDPVAPRMGVRHCVGDPGALPGRRAVGVGEHRQALERPAPQRLRAIAVSLAAAPTAARSRRGPRRPRPGLARSKSISATARPESKITLSRFGSLWLTRPSLNRRGTAPGHRWPRGSNDRTDSW